MVTVGTRWHQMVSDGTSWYQMVPYGTAAAQHDTEAVVAPAPSEPISGTVHGLEELLDAARVPMHARATLFREVLDTGAVDVREMGRPDWEALNAWSGLREMERRRVLHLVGQ